MCMSRRWSLTLLVLCTTLLTIGQVGRGDEDPFPYPSREAITNAQEKIREVYKGELAKANKQSEKSMLAAALLTAADGVGQDDASRLVLITMARDLAVDANDARRAIRAVSALVKRFQPDGPTDPKQQIEHGNAIWKEAETADAVKRLGLKIQAAEWYLRAQPSVTGFDETMIAKRLAEFGEVKPEAKPEVKPPDVQKWFVVTYRMQNGKIAADEILAFTEDGAKERLYAKHPHAVIASIKVKRKSFMVTYRRKNGIIGTDEIYALTPQDAKEKLHDQYPQAVIRSVEER